MRAARKERYDKFKLSKSFTHPRFYQRYKRIFGNKELGHTDVFLSALNSVFLFIICGLLAGSLFLMVMQGNNASFTNLTLWFYFILIFLIVAAGLANLSLRTREILINGNAKLAVLNCFLFGILLNLLLAIPYCILVITGTYDSMTANLPPVPSEADDRTSDASLIIFFLLQPLVLVLMNITIKNNQVFARFEGIGHVILGASSYLIALYTCQVFFTFLRNHILA